MVVLNKSNSITEHIKRNSVMGVWGTYVVWSQLTIYEIGSTNDGASVLVTVPGALHISALQPFQRGTGLSLPIDLLKIHSY